MYLGEINHRGRSYPGEHEPIVLPEMFAAVQELLAQRRNGKRNSAGKSQALLGGLVFDDRGNRMTPVHATKGAIRYRYYQSWVLGHGQKDKAGSVSRVPAGEVERAVIDALARRFPEDIGIVENLDAQADRVRATIGKVMIHPQHIAIELRAATVQNPSDAASEAAQHDGDVQSDGAILHEDRTETITIAWAKPAVTRNRNILTVSSSQPSLPPLKSETRARILTGIALGRLWLGQLASGKVPDIATLVLCHDRSEKSVRSLLSLAFLAPDIVEAAVMNKLPRGFGITDLTDLPANWVEQRRQLTLV